MANQIYCKHCGKQIDADSSFCMYCGGAIQNYTKEESLIRIIDRLGAKMVKYFINTISQFVIYTKHFWAVKVKKRITITDDINSIKRKEILEITNLKRIDVKISELDKYTTENLMYELPVSKHLYLNGKEIIDLYIPDSVSSIADYAFHKCDGLKSVVISKNISSLGKDIFAHCSNLLSITIDCNINSIGQETFLHCNSVTSFGGIYASEDNRCLIANGELIALAPRGLTEFIVPHSVSTIGAFAFRNCQNLTDVVILNSVTRIKHDAFKDCICLRNLTFNYKRIPFFEYDAFKDCKNLKIVKVRISDLAEYSVQNPMYQVPGCKHIYFKGKEIKTLIFPNTISEIGHCAFNRCASLTNLIIPDSVKNIKYGAFKNCSNLVGVKMGNGINKIGESIFEDCSKLTNITIPNSVTSIGDRAFQHCESLTSVTIPNSVTEIGDYAFAYCSSLTSVTIPDSVTSIGKGAFHGCTSLTSVTIPNNIDKIGAYAFEHCDNLRSIYFKSQTPPTRSFFSLFGFYGPGKVYVPQDSVETYKQYWTDYADDIDIVGYDF